MIPAPEKRALSFTKKVTSADDDQEFVCVVNFQDSKPTYTDNCSTVVHVRRLLLAVYPPIVGTQRGQQNVVLGCIITGLPSSNYITWTYYPIGNPTGFIIYSTYNNTVYDPANFNVPPMTSVGDVRSLDLVIITANPELATGYKCDITNTLGKGKSIHVFVLDPVECWRNSVEYDEGYEANISCSVNYYDQSLTYDPLITWYRDGQSIPGGVLIDESSTRKTLLLAKNVTSADDDHEFVCVVEVLNSDPTYTDNCSTVVHVRRKTISIFSPIVVAQTEEQSVFLGCNVTGLPFNNYIEWVYYPAWEPTGFIIYSSFNSINNDPTNFTVSHTTPVNGTQSLDLVINTANPELATQYACRMAPVVGIEATIDVVVLDPVECSSNSVEYDEGDEATISCSVNYYDLSKMYAPVITWYRDGQPIPGGVLIDESSTRKTLSLVKNVTSSDDDQQFVCVVNFQGSKSTYTDNCSTVVHVRDKHSNE